MPTVSICIPTYNRREHLTETLASMFAQAFKNFDVVVLDDGSTDGTKEMIKTKGCPVKYYLQENQGESAVRNKLLELPKGGLSNIYRFR